MFNAAVVPLPAITRQHGTEDTVGQIIDFVSVGLMRGMAVQDQWNIEDPKYIFLLRLGFRRGCQFGCAGALGRLSAMNAITPRLCSGVLW
jgi:hypothetical protein